MAKICSYQNDKALWLGCSTFGGCYNYIHQDSARAAKTNFTTIPQPCSIKVVYKRKTLYSGAHASFRLSAGHQSASPASGNNKTSSLPFHLGVRGQKYVKERVSEK